VKKASSRYKGKFLEGLSAKQERFLVTGDFFEAVTA